jgi:hypothetical protein
VISALGSILRALVAAEAPAATPPMITMLWGFSVDMEFTGPSMIFVPKSGLTLCGQGNKKACQEKSLLARQGQ